MSTSIDLSLIPAPDIIEEFSFETLLDQYITRFLEVWEEMRVKYPNLPLYNAEQVEYDPLIIVGQAWTYLRAQDRHRVNDALKALLAVHARGSNLDAVVARQGVTRALLAEADPFTGMPAVYEDDAALLRRYLSSFDRASAGSRDAYIFNALTAWPQAQDVAVNGHADHGRPGLVNVVVAGINGAAPTPEQLAVVRNAVTAPNRKPEAVNVAVIGATPVLYDIELVLHVRANSAKALQIEEATKRVRAAANERRLIGADLPLEYLVGPAYVPGVVAVIRILPLANIVTTSTQIPVCHEIRITAVEAAP